ncbi:hypothetical protein [Pseudooctadecabacter jejudonensis]|uniref:Lipoprotein n=1 Tax=Pseudooctadecabacter jejudonensis TaxID=1391910 RepID=A0A1Y5SCQ7_9RHOB|nr:hypothetical protein [Pseudooctadecabacter jejudonensis]SLN36219.1 hypothetical protein PSJ8397_01844 [Pseudooctadecabacter jejudonensis]
MILRGIKLTGLAVVVGGLSACMTPLPGGETGPFAPGNTLTFFYQGVLTDPPEQAQIVECGNEFVSRSCVRQSNGVTLPLEGTETGAVMYGNETLQIVLQPDAGGVPSGVGQLNNLEEGTSNGMRWVSLPS